MFDDDYRLFYGSRVTIPLIDYSLSFSFFGFPIHSAQSQSIRVRKKRLHFLFKRSTFFLNETSINYNLA